MHSLSPSAISDEIRLMKNILFKHKWETIMVTVSIAMGLTVFWYGDGQSLTVYSVEFWDALFSGRVQDYYTVTVENLRNAPHGGGTGFVLAILPWAIWNFPIWLTHTFSGNFTVLTPLCIIWSKLFLVLCWVAVGMMCYHIVVFFTRDKERASIAPFFIWGSGTIFISVGYAMQDEIIYILFFLLAIYCFLNNQQGWSTFWMVMSVTLYPVMMILALFLIIAKSKNIIKIFFYCILSLLPTFLAIFLFAAPSPPPDTTTIVDYLSWYFERTQILTPFGSLSFFALFLTILYCLFYFTNFSSSIVKNGMLIYSLAFCTVSMTLLSWMHFYRLFCYLPFLIICIFLCNSKSKNRVSLFLLTIFECSLIIFPCFAYSEYLNTTATMPYLQSFFLRRGVPNNLFEAILAWFPQLKYFTGLLVAVTFAVGICLLYIVWPYNVGEYALSIPEYIISKLYTVCPVLLAVAFCCIPIMSNVLSVPINGYSFLAPAIDGKTALLAYYYCENSRIKSIEIQPVTWGRDYPDTLKLCIDIIDAQTNETLGKVEILADELPNNLPYQVEIPPIVFNRQSWYCFKIYASEQINNKEDNLFLLRSDEGMNNPKSHYGVIIYKNDGTEHQEELEWYFISKIVGIF